MEGTVVKTEDLQVGDEVIISGYDLRYLKILRPPQLRTKPTVWQTTAVGYKTIKCLEMDSKLGISHPDREVYFDFNYKMAWLVKRDSHVS